MWKEFFKFDLEYQLRQPLLWVCALILGALAFGATTSDRTGPSWPLNSRTRFPFATSQSLTIPSLPAVRNCVALVMTARPLTRFSSAAC